MQNSQLSPTNIVKLKEQKNQLGASYVNRRKESFTQASKFILEPNGFNKQNIGTASGVATVNDLNIQILSNSKDLKESKQQLQKLQNQQFLPSLQEQSNIKDYQVEKNHESSMGRVRGEQMIIQDQNYRRQSQVVTEGNSYIAQQLKDQNKYDTFAINSPTSIKVKDNENKFGSRHREYFSDHNSAIKIKADAKIATPSTIIRSPERNNQPFSSAQKYERDQVSGGGSGSKMRTASKQRYIKQEINNLKYSTNLNNLNNSTVSSNNQTNDNTSYIVSLPFIKSNKEYYQQVAVKQQAKLQSSSQGMQQSSVIYGGGSSSTNTQVVSQGSSSIKAGSTGFKELGINYLDNELHKQGRITQENSIQITDEAEKKMNQISLLNEQNYQKAKLKNKKNNLTSRQLVQVALLDRNQENQTLQRNERFINNLHSNLTVNGQKQELIQNQSPEIAQQQNIAKRKYIRQNTKSQDPHQIIQPFPSNIGAHMNQQQEKQHKLSQNAQTQPFNTETNTFRGPQMSASNQFEKPIIKTQYNHQFSNIKGSARGSSTNVQQNIHTDVNPFSNTDTQSIVQQPNNVHQNQNIAPFNDRREAIRNKILIASQNNIEKEQSDQVSIQNPTYAYTNEPHNYETNFQSPKNQQQLNQQQISNQVVVSKQPFALSQSPYEMLIKKSNIIITEKGNISNVQSLPNGLSFASPSLEYRKKKRDYFPSSSGSSAVNSNQNKNHHQNPLQSMQAHQQYMSLSKANQLINIANDFKNQLQSQQKQSANNNINQLINHLNVNRIGNPHLSFAQVLKNMNNKVNYNQVPVTNIDTFENIKRDYKSIQEQNFSILVRSASQDLIDGQYSVTQDANIGLDSASVASVLPQDEGQRKEKNFVKIKKNSSNNQNYSHIERKSISQNRVLNADELYEMAKKLKKQNKIKEGIMELQSMQQNINRSQDNIQQLQQQQQQNLLSYLNSKAIQLADQYKNSHYNQSNNQGNNNNNQDIPGALNIQRLRTKQVKNEGMAIDLYQIKQKDMQLIQKYSKKGLNLLQSYEDYVQQSQIQANDATRNMRSQLLSNDSHNNKDHSKSIHTKVNQSADFTVAGIGSQNQSATYLMSIQEIQPILRSEDKRATAATTIREREQFKPATLVVDDHEFEKKQVDIQENSADEDGDMDNSNKNNQGGTSKNQKGQSNTFIQQQQQLQKYQVQQRTWQTSKAKLQQQQLKTYDLDKLLQGFYQEKDSKNPLLNKKKLEIDFHDITNDLFQNHQINKTIKQMSLMSNLMFRTKEYGNISYEILYRCTRYFCIPIPKQYKNDIISLMKNKEFLTLVKEKMHLMLFNHVNKANQINESQQPNQPRYIIGNGNNHMLVKSVFKTRQWWVQSEKENFEDCNFIWTQWLKERHIQSLTTLDKKNQSSNNQDPQEENLHVTRIYNKMHNNHNLSDKKHLFQNMREYYIKKSIDPFKILPLTYVIENGLNDVEFDKFESKFQGFARKQGEMENIWIIKPGEDTNRGSGIIVSKDFNEIKQLVRDKAARGVDKTAILQKYIENPLLINKRKFDIRCYGLLTSINGNLMGYFYQDGYLRTSCKEFSVQNLSNKFIHLTNDAIQKHSDDYGKFENANKLSFSDFDKYFENSNSDYDLRFQRDFLPQIRGIIRDSFNAVSGKLDPERRLNTFEIFGYDFMITDSHELKLIEANTNPSIEICCPLLARIVPNLIDSAFKIAIDPLFPPPLGKKSTGAWGSGNEVLNEIKFELIFQAEGSKQSS